MDCSDSGRSLPFYILNLGMKEGELVIITPEASKPGKNVRAEVMPLAFMED